MLIWEPLYSPIIYVLAGSLIAVLLLAVRQIAVSSKQRSWTLLIIRAIVFAILILLLLNPLDRRETELPPRPPAVAMLVDCSQSMGLGRDQSRIEIAKQMIGSVTAKVQKERELELPLFRFGSRMAKVPGLSEYSAIDDASRLDEALQRLPSRIANNQTRSIVLFSDGAFEDSEQLKKLATAYRDLKLPIHVMLPDEQALIGDVAITELAVPTRVAQGDQTTIRAVIESRGFEDHRTMVAIRRAGQPQSAPIASLPITLHEGENSCELVITADPKLGELAIDVPVSAGEAVSTNNRVPFHVLDRDRKLRVLYMEGTSAAECRWLQDALHADPDMQCVSLTVNNQYAQRPQLQRVDDRYKGFPSTRAELFQYDVVICSDIAEQAFTPEQIDWTVELVDRRGGGFVMIGGYTSFGAGGWDRTPWEGLIPFDMSGRRDLLNQGFYVDVPQAAQSHPIWKLVDDPDANRKALAAMPPFSGTNLISRVKPAATLLGQSRSALPQVGIMPIFACETYGRGRTFAMATDTTYGWGSRFEQEWGEGDNRYYQQFWRNVVRWLAENSQSSQRRLLVRTDQVIYSPGEPVELVAEAFDANMQLTTNYQLTAQWFRSEDGVEAESADQPTTVGAGSLISLEPSTTAKHYTALIPSDLPSSVDDRSSPMQPVRLVVTAWDGDKKVAVNQVELQLLHRSLEWLRPQSQPDTIRMIAEAGGGRVLRSSEDLLGLLRSIEIAPGEILVHKLPLWDRWSLWASLIFLLAIDWVLRRRGVAA